MHIDLYKRRYLAGGAHSTPLQFPAVPPFFLLPFFLSSLLPSFLPSFLGFHPSRLTNLPPFAPFCFHAPYCRDASLESRRISGYVYPRYTGLIRFPSTPPLSSSTRGLRSLSSTNFSNVCTTVNKALSSLLLFFSFFFFFSFCLSHNLRLESVYTPRRQLRSYNRLRPVEEIRVQFQNFVKINTNENIKFVETDCYDVWRGNTCCKRIYRSIRIREAKLARRHLTRVEPPEQETHSAPLCRERTDRERPRECRVRADWRIRAGHRDDDKRKTKGRRHPPGYIPGALWPAKPRPRTSHPRAFPSCLPRWLSPFPRGHLTSRARSPRQLRVCLPCVFFPKISLRNRGPTLCSPVGQSHYGRASGGVEDDCPSLRVGVSSGSCFWKMWKLEGG